MATLELLRPHLARAGLLAARIGAERAKVAAQTLDLLGPPAAVITVGNGRLRAANALFEALMPEVARERKGRLALPDAPADALLAEALARRDFRAQLATTPSIPVRAREGHCPFVFHLVPVRGLSPETLRSQLKSVFAKTGIQRQSDLVALLGGVAVPRRPEPPIAPVGRDGERRRGLRISAPPPRRGPERPSPSRAASRHRPARARAGPPTPGPRPRGRGRG